MIDLPDTVALPLTLDEHGTVRVRDTRVTLDTILACYHQGDTPEGIHTGFPTVAVADIYAIIAYYLAHQAEVDAYLKRQAAEAERLRETIEANYPPELRARLAYFRSVLAQQRHNTSE